ncbi:hypothetical protein Dimus_022305 [Dionaea muscipula]
MLTSIVKAFSVPLAKTDEKRSIDTDFFKETFLNMCRLKRENGVWWLGSGANRRRDGEDVIPNKDSNEEEESESKEESTPASFSEGEHTDSEKEIEDAKESTESVDNFFDVVDSGIATNEDNAAIGGYTQPVVQKMPE